MKIGYACKTIGVPGLEQKTCTKANATPARLEECIRHNLAVLRATLAYNRENGIEMFRISSDLIPFGSSPVNTLPWADLFSGEFAAIGREAAGMRLSMHPGQYTVLNSPRPDVVDSAVADLRYHAQVLDLLGLGREHKLVLHIGGAYGDKAAAKERFARRYHLLDDAVKRRLIIENDDKLFHVEDLLEISRKTGAPVVFDTLHHQINPPPEQAPVTEWIRRCGATWRREDGIPKIHYSQQDPGKKPGSHSRWIDPPPFLALAGQLRDVDIMLEVKDKNLSALACTICRSPTAAALEAEWSRYKYAVLERSQPLYLEIRALLKDKQTPRAARFYQLVHQALLCDRENFTSAAEHVWGYFKKTASPAEKKRFLAALEGYRGGTVPPQRVKRTLHTLARRYDQRYLLHSYYFDL